MRGTLFVLYTLLSAVDRRAVCMVGGTVCLFILFLCFHLKSCCCCCCCSLSAVVPFGKSKYHWRKVRWTLWDIFVGALLLVVSIAIPCFFCVCVFLFCFLPFFLRFYGIGRCPGVSSPWRGCWSPTYRLTSTARTSQRWDKIVLALRNYIRIIAAASHTQRVREREREIERMLAV